MTDKNPSTNKAAKADDRNLVASAESQTGPTLEERLLTLWQKYRIAILGAVVAVVVIIVGRELWQLVQASREAATREVYGQAVSAEQRLAFAREHQGHPLAGAALLGAADEAYADREYSLAAQRYTEALNALEEPHLAARARLGRGMAALQSDDAAQGVGALEQLAGDPAAPESLRIEALFHLASHAVAAGEQENARGYLDQLDALNPASIWASRAASLRARLPVEEEAAPSETALPGS